MHDSFVLIELMSVARQSTRVTFMNHGCKPQRRGKSNRNHVRNCRDHTSQGSPLKSSKGCVRLGIRSGRRNFLSCNRLPRIFNSLHMDISQLLLNESRNSLRFEETDYTSEVKRSSSLTVCPSNGNYCAAELDTNARKRIVTKQCRRYLSENRP